MKAVLYCRVDGPQTSFALDAIKGQQLYLMDYAKKNNIEIAGDISGCGVSWPDNGSSWLAICDPDFERGQRRCDFGCKL